MRNKQKGVTLVEMMIAVAIVAIAIVPLISMVIHGAKGTQQLSDRALASQLCQDMIEEIKQKRWDENIGAQTEVGWDDAAEDISSGGWNRTRWDDIDDYMCYGIATPRSGVPFNEHMVESPPVDQGNNMLGPRFDKFIRETTVRYVNIPLDGNVEWAGSG